MTLALPGKVRSRWALPASLRVRWATVRRGGLFSERGPELSHTLAQHENRLGIRRVGAGKATDKQGPSDAQLALEQISRRALAVTVLMAGGQTAERQLAVGRVLVMFKVIVSSSGAYYPLSAGALW